MIRIIILAGLLIVIFYCAAAESRRTHAANPSAARAARLLARVQHQFIPGGIAGLHARAGSFLVAAKPATADPNA